MAAIEDFNRQPVFEQLMFIFDTLTAGIQDDREDLRVVSLEVYRSTSASSHTTSSAPAL
jgi:hypothetical protein